MRILQLIDSLEPGGAERMAVNYANTLQKELGFSAIVASRKEGELVQDLNQDVQYLFLNKKHRFDLKAIFRLRKFVRKNKVDLVHAHSTSFFSAFLLKLMDPKIKLVWHDHYGHSDFLNKRPTLLLKIINYSFFGIITVNHKLKAWAEKKLGHKNVVFLPNFVSAPKNISDVTNLKGSTGKRILCLANLREQKNHLLLLDVAKMVKGSHPEWTFHLVGHDFEDQYSGHIKKKISEFGLEETVYYYGSRQDITNILEQVSIGVLTSNSEGLPLALLEYGIQKKGVVVTAVGEIPCIIENRRNGFMVAPSNETSFYNALVELMENENLRNELGKGLYQTVINEFSETVITEKYLHWINNN